MSILLFKRSQYLTLLGMVFGMGVWPPMAIAQAELPEALTPAAVEFRLRTLPEWTVVGTQLTTTCEFEDFVGAIAFVNRLVDPAERLAHHPDIQVAYNRLTLNLTTHDAGGLTELDLELATAISQLISHDGNTTAMQCFPAGAANAQSFHSHPLAAD
ncbi:MAG: 4a-hydroxytetrahydrobiopterin dehydratase [Cyanobacteria bacterium J06635_15]